ncbi:MAG TPA: metalloregulator ArsR/SmtB family transcription factor [Spirochaetia bacterium]|nr:metalloregulator ArsR/SmtB family transcription factor [Spirochaetia bacterium]
MKQSLAEARPRAVYLADVLKALAHPARLRIVAALCEGSQSVTELSRRLGLRQAVASQQLRILRMSGLVAAERGGGFATYSLAQPRLRQLVDCLEGCHSETAGAGGARTDGRTGRRAV